MHNEDSVFTEIIVPPAGNLDVEASELPPEPPVFFKKAGPFTTADLIAIYKLQKAGFVPSDFE